MMKRRKSKNPEIINLSDQYRNMILSHKAVELMESKDFDNLVKVAKCADFGIWTAIQAAFCMGYDAGKAGRE